MKKIIVPFVLLFSVTSYSQKKVYYTEDFKIIYRWRGRLLQYLWR
jgi:hypothetical protein